MKLACGIDCGARATKVVLLDERGELLSSATLPSSVPPERAATRGLDEAVTAIGARRSQIAAVTATGYGRNAIEAECRFTEISCHVKGAFAAVEGCRTVVDIGGQDSKVMSVGADGQIEDFVMNDRCAAGTGRFLEVISSILGVGVEELSDIALSSVKPAPISSLCVVFTESEVINLASQGCGASDIAAGVVDAMAERMRAIMGQVVTRDQVVFVGGVANNTALAERLEAKTGHHLLVPQEPQLNGAHGAALFSLEFTRR